MSKNQAPCVFIWELGGRTRKELRVKNKQLQKSIKRSYTPAKQENLE